MEEFIEINKMGLYKLDNGRHYEYLNHVYGLLHAVDATKIGIPAEKITEFRGDLDVEKEINLEAQANLNSRRMAEKDGERDGLLSFIFRTIHTNLLSPEQAMVAAADELNIIATPYYKIQWAAHDKESAAIDGLLTDFRKPENAPHVTTLQLTSALQKLETANNEFRQVYDARSATRASKKLPPAKEARAKTDALYERIVFILQAAYYYGIAPVERPLIASIAQKMNQRMEETDAAYRQSLAQKRAASKKKPKDPKDPKPKDPKQPGGGDDIHIPEEEPKKPEDKDKDKPKQPEEQPKPKQGDGGGDDIHVPEE